MADINHDAAMLLPATQDFCTPMDDMSNDDAASCIHDSPVADFKKIPIYVEVCVKKDAEVPAEEIRSAILRFLSNPEIKYVNGELPGLKEDETLSRCLVSARISDFESKEDVVLFWQAEFIVQLYQIHEKPLKSVEFDDEQSEVSSYHSWNIPAEEFVGLWESLVFDMSIKRKLLNYAISALLFSEMGVNTQLVSWNRVVLLFGPPGTGKTSLCMRILCSKGLSQKLAIRFSDRFSSAKLVEINAHSLFSKWFSESAKLVSKLFLKIEEMLEDRNSLICVLIDEVESLAAARQAALNGSDPSDSIRVVNALLTHLDALKRYPNALILATSNITDAIDVAFIDRADIKAYIGPPSLECRYRMLASSIEELHRAGVLTLEKNLEEKSSLFAPFHEISSSNEADAFVSLEVERSVELLSVARACENASGRFLRKLPFLAHATTGCTGSVAFQDYMTALFYAASPEKKV